MWRTKQGKYPSKGGEFSLGGQGTSKVGYLIRVGKDEDRLVVFQDMVVLIPTQGTYPTQHNSPHLGTKGRVE